ncbi:MAG: SLBB domain-containing protein, partial [Candidatus Aminicenantes bacterium]|nr:SLBB domain-containing protein [Candidatus Aminicenantes bacterium]
LKDGDQLFVPFNPGSVEVKGAVRNPSIFQYRKGKKLGYYIKLCGGYSKDADKANTVAYLPNNAAYKKKKFLFFSFSPSILPGSRIEVPFKGEEREIKIVELRGAVKKPTLIQYRRGEKLDYYINLCGGYKENADIENTIIHLPDGTILESKGVLSFNPYLLPGSVVEVPFKSEERELEIGDVEVRGAVKNPILIRYREGEKLDYYIDFCGGYKENADIENIVIHLPDGSFIEREGAISFDPDIPPGSVIEIPFIKKKGISMASEKEGMK